ncbi:hypothetical protein BJ742DRAFT_858759 [Cladochytrium replicatum]|nr:hypothetical protein BJ742DRAFT_858759 [Cladochytrium replicatum]
MSTTQADIHRYAGALVAEISVFMCFLESYQRIQNKHLKVSITLFVIFSLLVNALFLAGTALLGAGKLGLASPMFIAGSICWVIAWLNVTYHTSYRATLISLIGFQRPWIVAVVMVVCQGILSGTGSVFFTENFLASFGQTVDPRSTAITFVESFWYSIVETILFVITQYRIVSVRSRIKKVDMTVKIQLYWKAVSRSILYSLNVIMMFLSVGNAFGAGVGGNWSTYGHAVTLLILMTDSNRFQETIAILNGDAPRRTGITGATTFNSHSNGAVSGNNHSMSGDYDDKPAARSRNNNSSASSAKFAEYSKGSTAGSNYGGNAGGGAVLGTGGAAGQLYPPPSKAPSYSSINIEAGYGQGNDAQANPMPFGYPNQSQRYGGSQNAANYGGQNYSSQNSQNYGGSRY